ncbi:hypothetical protein EGR_09948 [Echinococcus granulosus]|uniref:Uncharacterized protein n=1 Tax=Echinococcus granulosus TaxID=6210 RepID=W6U248_ECHGR|nr:hypothetical protein EGR_09948 [Echinococcus granulosus]EUB55185.1 hypothetical protein EGR_09948 [Echinococcus granulosus]
MSECLKTRFNLKPTSFNVIHNLTYAVQYLFLNTVHLWQVRFGACEISNDTGNDHQRGAGHFKQIKHIFTRGSNASKRISKSLSNRHAIVHLFTKVNEITNTQMKLHALQLSVCVFIDILLNSNSLKLLVMKILGFYPPIILSFYSCVRLRIFYLFVCHLRVKQPFLKLHILICATTVKGRQTRLQTKLIYLYTMNLWISRSGRNSRVDLFACKCCKEICTVTSTFAMMTAKKQFIFLIFTSELHYLQNFTCGYARREKQQSKRKQNDTRICGPKNNALNSNAVILKLLRANKSINNNEICCIFLRNFVPFFTFECLGKFGFLVSGTNFFIVSEARLPPRRMFAHQGAS